MGLSVLIGRILHWWIGVSDDTEIKSKSNVDTSIMKEDLFSFDYINWRSKYRLKDLMVLLRPSSEDQFWSILNIIKYNDELNNGDCLEEYDGHVIFIYFLDMRSYWVRENVVSEMQIRGNSFHNIDANEFIDKNKLNSKVFPITTRTIWNDNFWYDRVHVMD